MAAAVTQFGKYQLFASLGKGGMADVFLSVARGQMGFNKLAVVKRLRPALAEEEAFRNMFLDEARLAARLNHPNIVHTYEVGEERGAYFIAMEYLEGQSLNKVQKELVRNKLRMPPELAVRIIADALAGLGHAHELRDYDGRSMNVIHRDVSPHNIFVTYDGHTKLMDFGIAKADTSSTETEVGVLKGKVAYMSPEQAMGQRIDQRSDLFAMGIVLWELLAQQRLMTGENAANTLHRLMNEPIPHIADIAPNIDIELDRLVSVSLEKDPNHRFQTAGEMRSALEAWLTRYGGPSTSRQEDVARQMVSLFGSVRAEVQSQVQKHMANVNNAQNTRELQALTAESLQRMQEEGNHISGALMRLGTSGSGSGSGVIANYGGLPPASSASGYPSFPPPNSSVGSFPPMPSQQTGPHQPEAARSNVLLIVITIGCFVLAALLIVLFGWRHQTAGTDPSPMPPVSSQPAATMSAAPSATSIEITTPTEIVSSGPAPKPKDTTHHTTAPAPQPRPQPQPIPKPAAPAPAPPSTDEPGFVTVSSYPWAKVTENGKVICAVTPCNKVSLSAGPHTLVFENGESPGQKQSVTVVIKPGETIPKNIGFK